MGGCVRLRWLPDADGCRHAVKNSHLFVGMTLIVGAGFFVLAITSTYTLRGIIASRLDPIELIFVGWLSGISELVVGYASMVTFGGRLSLGVADTVARIAGAKQVIEVRREPPNKLRHKMLHEAFLAYVPLIVFMLTVAIAWDFYNADSVHSGGFRPIFHLLDIFSRPVNANPIVYSVQVTPIMIFFTLLAGIVPSICLPYFRKFRVTGVNSGPFHKMFMTSIVGVVAGISVLFTLFGIFYEVLLQGKLPLFYRYILLDSVALSLYYGVGSYLGLGRAEEMVRKELVGKKWSRVVEGSVAVKSG